MSIPFLWGISVFWIVYGILGILGIQKIPEKYKYKSWTPDYIRMNGMAYLLLGGCWFILGFALRALSLPLLQELGLGRFLRCLPSGMGCMPTGKQRRGAGRQTRNGNGKSR